MKILTRQSRPVEHVWKKCTRCDLCMSTLCVMSVCALCKILGSLGETVRFAGFSLNRFQIMHFQIKARAGLKRD